jgi:hypothetical protein
MGHCNSRKSTTETKCLLCNDIIHHEYLSCGACDSDFHRQCYNYSLNEYGDLNQNARFTTCPNKICNRVGVIYRNSSPLINTTAKYRPENSDENIPVVDAYIV